MPTVVCMCLSQVLSVVGPSSSWEETQSGDTGGQWNSVADHVEVEPAPPPAQPSRPRVQFSGVEENSERKSRPRAKRSSKARVGCSGACRLVGVGVDGAGLRLWVWCP